MKYLAVAIVLLTTVSSLQAEDVVRRLGASFSVNADGSGLLGILNALTSGLLNRILSIGGDQYPGGGFLLGGGGSGELGNGPLGEIWNLFNFVTSGIPRQLFSNGHSWAGIDGGGAVGTNCRKKRNVKK